MADNEEQQAAAAAQPANVSAVKLPPFWANSPANWFRSVQSTTMIFPL
jgi:hypothetical protein